MIRRASEENPRRRRTTKGKGARGTAAHRSRDEIKTLLQSALRAKFPSDTVDVSDGYEDNIHILIVSRMFDDMTEHAKQEMIWSLIDESDLRESEKQLISLVLPLSPAQLK